MEAKISRATGPQESVFILLAGVVRKKKKTIIHIRPSRACKIEFISMPDDERRAIAPFYCLEEMCFVGGVRLQLNEKCVSR